MGNIINKKLNEKTLGMFLFAIACLYLVFTTYIGLTKIAVWSDEIYSIALASLPFNDFINYSFNDVHPILYYLIYRLFVHIFNIFNYTDVAVIGKVVSLIPLYLLFILSLTKIKKNFGMLAAGIFSLCIISMPQMMVYSVELRMYSWALFFVTATFVYAYGAVNNPSIKNWAILIVLTVCSMYTHYFALLAVGCIYLVMLIHLIKNNRELIKMWLVSAVISLLSFSLWIPQLLIQSGTNDTFWIGPMSIDKIITFIYFIFSPSEFFIVSGETISPSVWGTLFVIAVICLICVSYKKNKFSFDGIKVFILFMLIGITFSALVAPIFHPRYVIPVLGVLWLSVSIFLSENFKNRNIFIPVLVLMLIVGFVGGINFVNIQNEELNETVMLTNEFSNTLGSGNVIFFDESIPYLKLSQFYVNGDNEYILINNSNVCGSIENELNTAYIQEKIADGSDIYYVDAYDKNAAEFNNSSINLTKVNSQIKYDIYQINGGE